MSARDVIANALEFVVANPDHMIEDTDAEADAILVALSGAGYTIARLEIAGCHHPGSMDSFSEVGFAGLTAEEALDTEGGFYEPLYRIVASPVAPPVSREAQ